MNEDTKAFLTALFERIVPTKHGLYRLIGPIGQSEYDAFATVIGANGIGVSAPAPASAPSINLNLAVLSAQPIDEGCICIDFGTAASKIAYEPGADRFEPLEIGDPGGDPFWIRSAIALDAEGRMVFGRAAMQAGELTGMPVVTSFKSKLWGAPEILDATALERGDISFSYRDCIQAYLAMLTYKGAVQLMAKGVSPYIPRRYAMPFAYDDDRKHIREAFGQMLGRAVVLSDTFGEELLAGVEANRMRAALDALENVSVPDWLMMTPGCIGEPVAAGAFAMEEESGDLTVYMIADIGAGTTDFCILCIKKRADGEIEPIQIHNGALSIELAGDAVDAALVDFLVTEQAGEEYRARLIAEAPRLKEALFAPGAGESASVDLELGGLLIDVSRRDFLKSKQWSKIVKRLRAAQASCFDQADRKYLQDYGRGAIRVVLTGGGSFLPLGPALAKGRSPGKVKVNRIAVGDFPPNIRRRFAQIEVLLPRLAVSLGGSRDVLPADFDRSDALTSTGITAPYVWAALDKTQTGLEDV